MPTTVYKPVHEATETANCDKVTAIKLSLLLKNTSQKQEGHTQILVKLHHEGLQL